MEYFPEKKIISCNGCGKPFDAYPPDDHHTTASIKEEKDSIPIKYKCESCNKENMIYWYHPEPVIGTVE